MRDHVGSFFGVAGNSDGNDGTCAKIELNRWSYGRH